jgi:transposase InsO family protein
MRYHLNAVTNICQRQKIQSSDKSCRKLASKYEVSHVTVAKWKARNDPQDLSSAPQKVNYAVPKEYWKIIKVVRKKTLLSLDDLVEALSSYIPKLNRDNCFRILKHYQLNRLYPKQRQQRKQFATYQPGYLHIDIFYLPKIEVDGKKKRHYCFLAIDRATRTIFLKVYDQKNRYCAADFLISAVNFYPFYIHTILTDNGVEFSLKRAKYWGGKIETESLFDVVCNMVGIKHRVTKIRHPWTNGMAERAVGLVKEHTTKVHRYQNASSMIADIYAYQNFHNHHRKLKVLKGKTPQQMMIAWFVKKPKIFFKDPTTMQQIC